MSNKYKRDSASKALILINFEKLNEYTQNQNLMKETEALKIELHTIKNQLQEITKLLSNKKTNRCL